MSRDQQGFDPVLQAGQPQPSVMPITERGIEFIFMCCAQSPSFFQDTRRSLKSHYFEQGVETHFSLLWYALEFATDNYPAPLTYETLAAIIEQAISTMPIRQEMVFDLLRKDQFGLLWSMMYCPVATSDLAHGRAVLRQFLHERTVVAPLRRLMQNGYNGSYAETLPTFLTQLQEQTSRISSLDVLPRANVAPVRGSPMQQAMVFRRTGIEWIDGPLGGQRIGDSCGILGVTGGGKTTFAIQMAVATAKTAWTEAVATSATPGFVAFFTVEEPTGKILPRVHSSACKIPRKKLETMTDWSQLTTQANLAEYERRLGQVQGYVKSESERYDEGISWLEKTFELIDFSGSDAFPHAGEGYVDEMAGILDRLQQMRQQPVWSVYIDYAGLLCKRHMDSNNMDEAALRPLLTNFGESVRRKIAERFQCTTWSMHQVRADAGQSRPTKLMHHSDSAESKAFAVNMAVCGCIGVPDKATGCRRLNWSKVRFAADQQIHPVTLRINDMFAEMDDVSERYGVDEAGMKFVSMAELRQVAGAEATETRQAAMSGPQHLRREGSIIDANSTTTSVIDPRILDNEGV